MSDLVECPFCEYAAESEQSVRGHVSGKKDDSHSATYDELTELLGGSDSSTTESGSGPSFPSAPSDDSEACPDCGSDDYYTPSQVRDKGLTADELADYDRICAQCGELYNA